MECVKGVQAGKQCSETCDDCEHSGNGCDGIPCPKCGEVTILTAVGVRCVEGCLAAHYQVRLCFTGYISPQDTYAISEDEAIRQVRKHFNSVRAVELHDLKPWREADIAEEIK